MKLSLRDYQEQALADLRTSFAAGHKRNLLALPTGGGKTVIGCELMERTVAQGNRCLFLAHRRELIQQTSQKLFDIGTDHGLIQAGESQEYHHDIQVASVQTIVRRLNHNLGHFDLVIVDEAHRTNANTYQRILSALQPRFTVGLTATPYRSDGKPLNKSFDAIVEGPTMRQLIDRGYLVEPRVFAAGIVPDFSGVKTTGGDYNLQDSARVMDTGALTGEIIGNWREHCSDRKTVVFATTVDHAEHINARFKASGVRSAVVHGKLPQWQRENILEALSDGALQVVVNCMVLTEGWDQPDVSAVVLARPTKSRGLWKQMCGRALRPAENKTDCLIMDHANATKSFGFLDDPEEYSLEATISQRGKRIVRKTKPRKPEPKDMIEIEAKLEEVRRTTCGKAYSEFQVYAYHNGYKPGWADVMFKQQFNRWPTRMEKLSAPYKVENKQWTKPPREGKQLCMET